MLHTYLYIYRYSMCTCINIKYTKHTLEPLHSCSPQAAITQRFGLCRNTYNCQYFNTYVYTEYKHTYR